MASPLQTEYVARISKDLRDALSPVVALTATGILFLPAVKLPSTLNGLSAYVALYAAMRESGVSPALREFRFANTDRRRVNQWATVGVCANGPKGLGRDGYKPLMRNRMGITTRPSPTGYTVAHNFPP